MGIAIPPVATLWDLCLHRGRWGGTLPRSALRRLRLWAPLWALGVAYVLFRLAILGGVGGYGDRHLRFGAMDNHLVHYIAFLLQPLPVPWLDLQGGGKALAVVAAALGGLWALWRVAGLPAWRAAPLALGWFAVTWLPVATLLRQQYMFLPSAGVAIGVAGVLGPLLDEARRRAQTGIALAVALGALLWLLHAGNALLGQLKRWEAGGQIAQGVLQQTGQLMGGGLPPQTQLVYEGLPVNIGVPVFQHGISEGLRLLYRRDDVEAFRLPSFKDLPAEVDPARARFLSYDKGVLRDRTVEVRSGRAASGPG
jgi:hypothetical protein